MRIKRLRKQWEKMTKKELLELVEELIIDFNLYQCPKCGEFNQEGYLCWRCKQDSSLER